MKKPGTEVLDGSGITVVLPPPEPPQEPESTETAELTPDEAEDEPEDPLAAPYSESDSEMGLAEGESLPATRGRPPKRAADGTIGILGSKPRPVTRPHFRVYNSDAISPAKKSKAAYTFWNKLLDWEKSHIVCYVYRDHPIMFDPPIDPETKKPVMYKYIEKIDGSQPLMDDIDLLNRYGCGSYRLILTELAQSTTTRSTKESGQLCEIYVRHLGGADYKSNPPSDSRINDLSQLDVNNPGNAAYVAFLRGKGLLSESEEERKRKEDEEMAQVALTNDSNRTIEKLTDKLVDMAEKKNTAPVEPAMTRDDIRREVRDSMRDIIDQLKPALAPPAPQKDPMELALQLVTLMNGSRSASESELTALRAQLNESNNQQMQLLMKQIESLTAARTTEITTSASPFSGVTDGLGAIKQMKEMLEELGVVPSGVAEEAIVNPAAGLPKWAQAIVPLTPVITQLGTALIGYLTRPQGAGPMMPQQQYAPAPAPMSQPQPLNVIPMPPPGLPAPQQQQQQQTAPQQPIQLGQGTGSEQLDVLLLQIAGPLGNHLANPEVTGTDFAEWFAAGYGEDQHAQIASAGYTQIVQILLMHPATYQVLQQFTQERIQPFIEEFCNPKWDEVEEDVSAGKESTPPTTPTPDKTT